VTRNRLSGTFLVGVDLGKKQDHSAVAVLRKDEDALRLVLMKQFKLGTPYVSVIGYIKLLCDKLRHVVKICVDQTGSEYFVEDLEKIVGAQVEGVMLSQPKKQEVMGVLKSLMQEKKLLIPYNPLLHAELNVERFELTKTGQMVFSHPQGTNDDRLWALALAAYASRGPTRPRFRPHTKTF